ncbi:MAG: peptide ABC transporter substrate-binding protein [Oligoflexales bacterium]|nr:peptide ABC transporter substrate-binding protein [Oligoflexales bacterium]
MMRNKKSWVLKFSLILLLTPFVGFAKAKSELKIGITQEFENLNPIISSMLATTYIQYMVTRPLIVLTPSGKWLPVLVTEIPSLENGKAKIIQEGTKKKLIADWEIKANAKWGDGKPVTAHDFVFTRDVTMDPNTSTSQRDAWENMEKIDIDTKNPKKFTITYKEARWNFNRDMAVLPLVPKHIEETVFKKHGKQAQGYDKNSLYTTQATNPGLYNGPYVVKEIKLGSHVTLEPNPHFFGKKPEIEIITLKLIPNTGTLEANLRSGSIDMISPLGLAFDQALAFEKKVKAEKLPYDVHFKPSLTYEHIDLNLSNEFLKDVKVRKALVHSINRDELSQALFDGRQPKAIHNIAPVDPWYTDSDKDIVKYPYSRRTAQKLFKDAGWEKGADGFLYKNGKKLSLQIMTTAGNKVRELVQTYLQEQWKNVGVEITIKNEQARVFFGETTRKAAFPAMAMYAWISSPEKTPKTTLHSTYIPTKKNNYSGQNTTGWINKEVDKLIEDLDIEFDAIKRKEISAKILYHYTNDVPVIPLYYRSDISVTPKNISGYEITGTQYPETWEVENWKLKAANVNG